MDPITDINIKKDTSFAMLLKAQSRGYDIRYMEMSDLYIDNGNPMARMRSLSVEENPQQWFTLGEVELHSLAELDVQSTTRGVVRPPVSHVQFPIAVQ